MDGTERAAWLKFLEALEAVQSKAHDHEQRRQYLKMFKSELVLLSFWLHELRIGGGVPTRAVSPPEQCNFCGVDFAINGLHVDGQITDGRWTHMCLSCFGYHGVGVGWGAGQLYRLVGQDAEGEPIWRCIAGGDPELNDDSA